MLQPQVMLTDQYQLVMAYGYWKLGRADDKVSFHLTYRRHPFHGHFTIAAGLNRVVEFLQALRFTKEDIAYLKTLKAEDGSELFENDFYAYLSQLRFQCDVDAIPEGTPVSPQEPLLKITGPLLQCQLLETPLLNLLQFPSLVATKAVRVCIAADGDPVFEFGLRRAQGPDGGLTASRAAYIGGCVATSNVLAGQKFAIPIVGTQAHSWIMSFDDELEAFKRFAEVMSHNVILLVDTYDTVQGVKNAIKTGETLKKQGKELLAIRLDSGDLLTLSQKARKLLDDHGFTETKIIASGDLDEYTIKELKKAHAPINSWGVGTRLATCQDQPSLDVIYKLSAIEKNGQWQYKLKISDQSSKTTNPGLLQVRRFYQNDIPIKDIIYDEKLGISTQPPEQATRFEDLLVPVFLRGVCVYKIDSAQKIRERCLSLLNNYLKHGEGALSVQLDKNLAAIKEKLLRS